MTKVARRTETRLSGMLPRWLYRHLRPADVLSFVAGLCFPMGFSPYNLYVLPTLCLALLFAVNVKSDSGAYIHRVCCHNNVAPPIRCGE